MDTAGNGLLDAVYPPTSPFKACSVQLCSMLEGDPTEGYFGALFYHFCEEDEAQQLDMIERLRGKVLHMDAHLHWRIDSELDDVFYDLIRMIHPRLSTTDQIAAANRFWNAPECDLHGFNGMKVKAIFAGALAMYYDGAFRDTLKVFSKKAKLTNMHMERILGGIKQSSPGKRPMIDRVLAAGYMQQLLQIHRKAGGRSPNAMSDKDLIREGARASCDTEEASTRTGKA